MFKKVQKHSILKKAKGKSAQNGFFKRVCRNWVAKLKQWNPLLKIIVFESKL